MTASSQIQVQNLDHLGLVAGIIDEIGVVEQVNQLVGQHSCEKVSPGHIVKAMLINGLGFVSAPLYMFPKFFEGKATEHLIGEGVKAEHLNDDRLGRVLDKLYSTGLEQLFTSIALKAAKKYGVSTHSVHLDSSSFHVHGKYEGELPKVTFISGELNRDKPKWSDIEEKVAPSPIEITYGYSRDHRPDLKQFILDLISSGDGDVPLFLRVADGNEADNAVFAKILCEFREQLTLDNIAQQSAERGCGFLKDPLFFTDSIFINSPERVEALAMLMGLCLLVYTLGQRQLRQALQQAQSGIKNQLGKLTERPTLRWIFQCFQAVHLLFVKEVKQVSNLTDERLYILRFFPDACRHYYLLC
jgi:transposase